MRRIVAGVAGLAGLLCVFANAQAQQAETQPVTAQQAETESQGVPEAPPSLLEETILGGDFDLRLRYRYQFLDLEGFENDAHASTIRTTVKYETKPLYGVSLLGEIRNLARLGTQNLFNDTVTGLATDRPVIADPEALEVDQALLKINDVIPGTTLTGGRRKIALNNQRFVSTLPFRQNSNSFDGAVVENVSLPNTYLHYSYALNFNRAFTDRSPVGNFDEANFHLFHAEHDHAEWLRLVSYAYLLGIEEESFAGASNFATNTFGVNAKGKLPIDKDLTFHYDLEYAHQIDNEENTLGINLNYYRISPGITYKGLRANLGLEVLEGNGDIGFATPLALLHAFNGFADVFVTTPTDGLRDAFFNVTYSVKDSGLKIGDYDIFGDTKFHVAYHYFSAENSSNDFGHEIDFSMTKKFTDHVSLQFEFARFFSDNSGPVSESTPVFEQDVTQFLMALMIKY